MTPVALTIAGSDPSGGAGIQADLKTFHQFGVYGQAVIALLTVQNTLGVSGVRLIDAAFVGQQIEAAICDMPPGAVKTGALGGVEQIEVVAELAQRFTCPLIVDPVMLSKNGTPLMMAEAILCLKRQLLPGCYLVTPNVAEAEVLSGLSITDVADLEVAAKEILRLGPRSVLVKGGHLGGAPTDVLLHEGRIHRFPGERIDTRHVHGTGCVYSAAITALVAKGVPLVEAVRRAKAFIQAAIRTAPGLGSGSGPVNHFAAVSDVSF